MAMAPMTPTEANAQHINRRRVGSAHWVSGLCE